MGLRPVSVLKEGGWIRTAIGTVIILSGALSPIFEVGVTPYWLDLWVVSYAVAGVGMFIAMKGILLLRKANKMVPELNLEDNEGDQPDDSM